MRFPSIRDVARELRELSTNVECDSEGCDVRLQVYDSGAWAIRCGDSGYDTDHHGYWGASSIPGVVGGRVVRFNARDVARDLIEQAREQRATEVDGK